MMNSLIPSVLLTQLALAWLLLSTLVDVQGTRVGAIDSITRRGKYLYKPNGDRFYIKGVAYQEAAPIATSTAANQANGGFPEPDSFVDPLSAENAANCTRDIANLKTLGVNTVRVYSVNSTLNHDSCMSTLSDAGIYVILDLALPLNGSINRAEPSWDVSLLNLYLSTVDAFVKYDNLLAFSVGNEVVTQASNTEAAPFIKAAARDVKAYLKSINKSNIMLTYASTDGPAGLTSWRDQLANYLTCGGEEESIDMYGLNSYAWCGNSSYSASGYASLTTELASLPIPAYLSEFGCVNIPGGSTARPWTEVAALLSAPMTDTWSGGVAFSYFQQAPNTPNYGLTTVSGSGSQLTLTPDFDRLRAQYASASPPTGAGPTSNSAYPSCPSGDASSSFRASGNLPPTPNSKLCDCAQQNAWTCLATPVTANQPAEIGQLLGSACSQLSQRSNANCLPIAANGTTGTYGNYSFCSPVQRLDWAFSAYFDSQNRTATACNFGGAAARSARTGALTVTAAQEAAQTCLQQDSKGTFTPTSPTPGGPATSTTSRPGSGSGGGGSSSAASLLPATGLVSLFGLLALALIH